MTTTTSTIDHAEFVLADPSTWGPVETEVKNLVDAETLIKAGRPGLTPMDAMTCFLTHRDHLAEVTTPAQKKTYRNLCVAALRLHDQLCHVRWYESSKPYRARTIEILSQRALSRYNATALGQTIAQPLAAAISGLNLSPVIHVAAPVVHVAAPAPAPVQVTAAQFEALSVELASFRAQLTPPASVVETAPVVAAEAPVVETVPAVDPAPIMAPSAPVAQAAMSRKERRAAKKGLSSLASLAAQ